VLDYRPTDGDISPLYPRHSRREVKTARTQCAQVMPETVTVVIIGHNIGRSAARLRRDF
jgi:hypothetical protein